MRVVSGRLGGRRLAAERGDHTRPTSDRARAGLFDWLGPRIEAERVLDLFAGTGALGIEALSRGGGHATFVERSRNAAAVLRRNLRDLELEETSRVVVRDVRRALPALAEGEGFDLILADPPYGRGWPPELVHCATLLRCLRSGGILVVERGARESPAEPGRALRLRGSRRHGETAFDWYDTGEMPG